MKPVYCCGGEIFETLTLAVEYSNLMYIKKGIILGIEVIEQVVVPIQHILVFRQRNRIGICHDACGILQCEYNGFFISRFILIIDIIIKVYYEFKVIITR